MSRGTNPFSAKTVLILLLVGSLSFLLLLYALSAGWTGGGDRSGVAHANANDLTGYSAITKLLEERGHSVSLARKRSELEEETLLVITPSSSHDPEELEELLQDRMYQGPTILVLPKWVAIPIPPIMQTETETQDDWTILLTTTQPTWFDEVESLDGAELGGGSTQGWSGFGLEGVLPDAEQVQGIKGEGNTVMFPLIRDSEGDFLAAYLDKDGYHPVLADSAGVFFDKDDEQYQDDTIWPIVIVAEPDLLNNYGMADQERARVAVALIENSLDGYELPIVFDMTLPGLGSSENLLTLAFQPPFLAATLCLLLLAFVIAWRSFRRFGPPAIEAPAMAQGKTQLARNGAALIERAKRWHLLGEPYAALVSERVAKMLHIRESERPAREAAIDQVLIHHGISDQRFSEKAEALRNAHRPADMVRAAIALRSIERMLKR